MALPRVTHHTLAGIAAADVGEFAIEGGSDDQPPLKDISAEVEVSAALSATSVPGCDLLSILPLLRTALPRQGYRTSPGRRALTCQCFYLIQGW